MIPLKRTQKFQSVEDLNKNRRLRWDARTAPSDGGAKEKMPDDNIVPIANWATRVMQLKLGRSTLWSSLTSPAMATANMTTLR